MRPRKLPALLLALLVCLPATVWGAFDTVADFNTPNPLGGNFSRFSQDNLSPALANGTVVFIGASPGFNGSYFSAPAAGGAVTSLVKYTDPLPGEPGPPFPGFASFGGFSLDGGTAIFYGGGPPGPGLGGLYAWAGGVVTSVVNTHTPIPNFAGSFSVFGYGPPSADRGQVAFFGRSSIGGNSGVYLTTPGGLVAVADKFTTVPGTAETFPGNFATTVSLDGGEVAFVAQERIGDGLDTISRAS